MAYSALSFEEDLTVLGYAVEDAYDDGYYVYPSNASGKFDGN